MKSTEQIVLAFFDTFGTDKDWTYLLSEHITFSSPMDEVLGKDKFIELDIQFRSLVKQAKVKWLITTTDRASAIVLYQMTLPTGDNLQIEFSEIIEIRDQKIESIKVFFDTAKFYEFLSRLESSSVNKPDSI